MRHETKKPSLTINFSSGVTSPLISFSRVGAASTRINESGFIEFVSADVARLDYNPTTLSCRGLLIEESRANLLPNSNSFANATYWAENGTPDVLDNQVSSPDGTTNASTIEVSGSSNGHGVFSPVAYPAGTYAVSLYFKPISGNFVMRLGFGVRSSTVNMNTLAVVNGTDSIGSVEQGPNGFYRFKVVVTTIIATPLNIYNIGSNTGKIAIYGAQIEVGTFVTSHIPTTTASLTRNADVATITGTNFSDFWQAGKGSALVRARPSTISGVRPVLQFDDATADNIIALRGNGANPELYVRTGGVDQAQIDAGTIAANTSYRLAGAWAENSCAASLNSGAAVLDGVATIPTVTQARLGSDGTNYLNGHIEAIEYYDERVPNSALQVVSSAAGYQSIIGSVFRDAVIS